MPHIKVWYKKISAHFDPFAHFAWETERVPPHDLMALDPHFSISLRRNSVITSLPKSLALQRTINKEKGEGDGDYWYVNSKNNYLLPYLLYVTSIIYVCKYRIDIAYVRNVIILIRKNNMKLIIEVFGRVGYINN